MHGFQLWVNLPAADKMMAPRYQEIPRARIPQAQTADGLAQVRVVAGEALGARAVIETRTPIAYHDWTLRPGAAVDVPLPRRSPPTSTCSQARPRSAAARSKRASWRLAGGRLIYVRSSSTEKFRREIQPVALVSLLDLLRFSRDGLNMRKGTLRLEFAGCDDASHTKKLALPVNTTPRGGPVLTLRS